MRRFVLFSFFAGLLGVAGLSQGNRTRELAPGVWMWQGDREAREPANCGWVEFKDYVLVIDANFPWGAKKILPEIRRTTKKPLRFVFNTHYHGDHAYGGSLFTDQGAAILCSEDCAAESRTKGQAGWDKNSESGAFSLKPYHLAHPTITFPRKMVLDDGDKRVELIKVGPGHSKGDAVAYLPKQKLLFTGDLCTNWKSGNNVADADADPANWVKALTDMAKWDVKTVVPGHGGLGDVSTLQAQAAYLDDMWKQVSAGKRQKKTEEQLAAQINLSRHGNWAADAERNKVSIRAMYKKAK
jgi:cyclase